MVIKYEYECYSAEDYYIVIDYLNVSIKVC